MTKIVGITTVWKRPEITELCLKHYQEVQARTNIDLKLIAVGSEGEHSRRLCERYGFEYIEFPNRPLIQKTQAGILAAKKYDPDAVVRLDSDDLISSNYFEALYDAMTERGYDVAGFYDMYFYDVRTVGEMMHWVDGLKRPNGAGMMIKRRALDVHDFRVFPKDSDVNCGQDGVLFEYLEPEGIKIGSFLLRELGVTTISLKSKTNIWRYYRFKETETYVTLTPLDSIKKICSLNRR